VSPATQLKLALDERPLGQELPLRFENDSGQDVSRGAESCCSRPMSVTPISNVACTTIRRSIDTTSSFSRSWRAHVAPSPQHPEMLHYTDDGVFMVSGRIISRRSQFRPGML
jgi:hypothetical protein